MQWHQLDHIQTIYSTARSRRITTPTPHHSIFTGRMLFLTSNQQCQSTEGVTHTANIALHWQQQTTFKAVLRNSIRDKALLYNWWRNKYTATFAKMKLMMRQLQHANSKSIIQSLIESLLTKYDNKKYIYITNQLQQWQAAGGGISPS